MFRTFAAGSVIAGVFAAYLDVLYNSALVSTIDAPTPNPNPPFDFLVDFGEIGVPDRDPALRRQHLYQWAFGHGQRHEAESDR